MKEDNIPWGQRKSIRVTRSDQAAEERRFADQPLERSSTDIPQEEELFRNGGIPLKIDVGAVVDLEGYKKAGQGQVDATRPKHDKAIRGAALVARFRPDMQPLNPLT
ncbi:hypothetical protein EHS25_005624 [Saitozyma podzolica]|uniref:Uncharacterized protein n=1 Tax=Saitozyma podzolica TaxID=1890683 RepID=A0A427XXZ8_9TREE|nr:hypothetical protein EHS25_005624 [Saitozyma podzolica]